MMADKEAKYSSSGSSLSLHDFLVQHTSGRSLEAIKGVRKRPTYKVLVAKLIQENGEIDESSTTSTESDAEVDGPPDPLEPVRALLVEMTNRRIESEDHHLTFLIEGVKHFLESGDLAFILDWLKLCFTQSGETRRMHG